jgi:phosphoribosylformylglycinamidine synthase
MWSFSEVIDGITEACKVFETPVISGNVSFYNETDGKGILPTPTIGMVGLLEDVRKLITHGFKNEGDVIALLGVTNDDLSVSEYAQTVLGYTTDELIESGEVPKLDLQLEKLVQDTCLSLSDRQLLKSAHDCSEGGIAVTIAESCFSSLNRKSIGAEINLTDGNLDASTQLFSESPSRIVVSFAAENLDAVKDIAGTCPFAVIGKVTGDSLDISVNGVEVVSSKIEDLENVWNNPLENQLN